MLRIQRHAVVPLASTHRISASDLVGRGIDHCEQILILEIDVDLSRDRIVLQSNRFPPGPGSSNVVSSLSVGVGAAAGPAWASSSRLTRSISEIVRTSEILSCGVILVDAS